jgi:small subunit ribosomal protein S6
MPEHTAIYDLMLLLSTTAEDERRAKILADVQKAIADSQGTIVHTGDWGPRAMTYRIDHQDGAEYHLVQFTGPPALLDSLNHSLRITDGVLRFRIIKVRPGTPPPPTPEPMTVAAPREPVAAAVPAESAPEVEAEAAETAGEDAPQADE